MKQGLACRFFFLQFCYSATALSLKGVRVYNQRSLNGKTSVLAVVLVCGVSELIVTVLGQ